MGHGTPCNIVTTSLPTLRSTSLSQRAIYTHACTRGWHKTRAGIYASGTTAKVAIVALNTLHGLCITTGHVRAILQQAAGALRTH